jgi:hypothetical protein
MTRASSTIARLGGSIVAIAFIPLCIEIALPGKAMEAAPFEVAQLGTAPITNPGVSGDNYPTLNLPSSSITIGGSPVTNPGVSGIDNPVSSQQTISAPTPDQPISNPGVSGANNPVFGQSVSPFTPNQPITNPGVSGVNSPTPGLTQPTAESTNSVGISSYSPEPNIVEIIPNQLLSIPRVTTSSQSPVTPAQTRLSTNSPTKSPVVSSSPQTTIVDQFRTANTTQFDPQLLQATCSQNWKQALQLVDRSLRSAPSNQTSALRAYRDRLQTLASNQTFVPNWQQQCKGS